MTDRYGPESSQDNLSRSGYDLLEKNYHHLDQLTGEQSAGDPLDANGYLENYNYQFQYDASGNPTQFRNVNNPNYNLDNQFGIQGFVYDGNGNPTSYNGQSLTFDPENHLTSTATIAGYDGEGLRAWKSSGSSKTFYLYDGYHPVAEIDIQRGALWNGYGANGLTARSAVEGASSTPVFYGYDPQGNLVHRYDPNSDHASISALYDAFGARLGQYSAWDSGGAGISDPVGFGGQYGNHSIC